MNKTRLGAFPFIYPLPTVLLGADADGKPNYNAIGNCGIMCLDPPTVYVSSHRSHHTNTGIRQNGNFSINIPSVPLVEATDYCGLVSGNDRDKSGIFTSFYGDLESAPMIEECPINLECRVREIVSIHEMEVFIADVVQAYGGADCLVNGTPDIKKIDPIIYSLDASYWCVGSEVAKAFSVGKEHRRDTSP